jgi:hypothetical protein
VRPMGMSGVRTALVALGLVLPLAGCAGDASTTAAPGSSASVVTPRQATHIPTPPSASPTGQPQSPGGPAATGLPQVTLRRTGGFVGVFQILVIQPDGGWIWTDGRDGPESSGASKIGRLNAAQRGELARLVADPALAAEASSRRGAPKCNDGFLYSLAVGERTVVWGDCGEVTPPTATAITNLLATATPL